MSKLKMIKTRRKVKTPSILRCHVKDRVGAFTVDGRSCINVTSKLVVDKLGFKTQKHPRHYHL